MGSDYPQLSKSLELSNNRSRQRSDGEGALEIPYPSGSPKRAIMRNGSFQFNEVAA
jgi:hypothetical protein